MPTTEQQNSSWGTLQHPALMQALAHPMRARMLGILQERQASPKELSEEFDIPLANVAYHIQVLRKLKLIKLVKRTPRRGAVEHHYRADRAAFVNDETWAETPGVVKDAAVAAVLAEVGDAATKAAGIAGFSHADAHLTHSLLTLDGQAWDELSRMLMRVLERSQELVSESEERLRAADHAGERHTGLVMMLFESSPSVPDDASAALKAGPAPADPHARAAQLAAE